MTKHISLLSIFLLMSASFFSQITPPYSTSFETDNSNWSHGSTAEIGTDDWQRGGSTGILSTPRTGNYAWCTNVNGNASFGSYALESPSFDLSNTDVEYVLSFYHKYDFTNTGRVQYSLDNGETWQAMPSSFGENSNWSNPYTGSSVYWKRARISLASIQGINNVRFHFNIYASEATDSGWLIDDFEIRIKGNPDLIAINGSYIGGLPSNKEIFPISI